MKYVIFKGQRYFTKDHKLDLSKLGIHKISEIENLNKISNLKIMILTFNNIKKIEGLDTLSNLEELYINENCIKEIENLNSLKNLKALDLSGNFINKIQGLDNLINLQKLELGGNQISKIEGLKKLISLKELSLNINFEISEIKGLDTLNNLQELSLEVNQITKISGLENLINLQKLNLSNNQITKIERVDNLINLYSLNLFANQISKIENLNKLSNLQELDLSHNQISEIEGLDKLNKLKKLYLNENKISEIKGLDKLTNLRDLVLFRNILSKIKGLNKLINLRDLVLFRNNISKIEGLDNLRNLRGLYIGNNNILKIEGLGNLSKLQTLELHHNRIIKIEQLNTLTNLQKLNLEHNQIEIIEGLYNLINLSNLNLEANNITDGKEFVKLLAYKSLHFIEIDYEKLRTVDSGERKQIIEFLKQSYDRLNNQHIKNKEERNFLFIDTSLLDRMIGISNILVNLYHDDWEKEKIFKNNLITSIEEKIALITYGTKKYYKMTALKNILYAGMERPYSKQVKYLEKAIEFFKKAEENKCQFFYQIYLYLIKSLVAHLNEDLKESRKYIEKIFELYPKFEHLDFQPSLIKLINELPAIQKDLIDFTIEPQQLEDLINNCSKQCDEIIHNTFPLLKFSKPGIYRMLYHIINNMKKSWKRISSSDIKKIKNIKNKKDWNDLIDFFDNELDLKMIPKEIFSDENKLSEYLCRELKQIFQTVILNEPISGMSHVDISVNTIIAIEIKKIESKTAFDELRGQIMEDLRIGRYEYGIAFGIDITKQKLYIRFNNTMLRDDFKRNIVYIIKPYHH